MGTATWEKARRRYGGGKSVRGRDAESPHQMTAKGWKDVLWRVKNGFSEDQISTNAAAMAYYSLLAFVPALTALVLMYAWISDPQDIQSHFSSVSEDVIPVEITQIVNEQLQSLAGQNTNTSLGIGAISALFFALWSASKGSNALVDSLNIIYKEKNDRGFIRSNLLALGLTLLGTVVGIVALGVLILYPNVIKFIPLPDVVQTWTWVGSSAILLFLFSLYLSVAYRFGPHRRKAKWKWVSWGAVIASLLWAVISAGFSFYATEFGNFNKTYGSMAAIVVMMMWLYLSSIAILIGAEINAELEHQTLRDTTTDPEKGIGERGAYVADSIGPTVEQTKERTPSDRGSSENQTYH